MNLEPEVPKVDKLDDVVLEGDPPETPAEADPPNETEAVETEVIEAPEETPEETNLVKRLRKLVNDKNKQLADMRKAAPVQAPAVARPKPKLSDDDIGWDEDKHEAALEKWILDNKEHEKSAEKAKQAAQAQQETWNTKVAKYMKEKAALGDEADLAQDIVEAVTSQAQQAVIIQAAQNPAAFVHGLSKRDDLLEIASKITDPIEFAAFVARTEANMNKPARPKPPAESVVRSAGGAMPNRNLDDAIKKSQASGDYRGALAAIRAQKSLQKDKK